jgi:hypothetical protein
MTVASPLILVFWLPVSVTGIGIDEPTKAATFITSFPVLARCRSGSMNSIASPDGHVLQPLFLRAKVAVKIKEGTQSIGLMGHYRELVLDFPGPLDGVKHVRAQDFLSEEADDIHDKVRIEGSRIPGGLIARPEGLR